MISELFSVSTDELLKNEKHYESNTDNKGENSLTLEEVIKLNLAHKQIIMGFSSIVLGSILLILEFMFLPIFGKMQKEQVDGDGFYFNFIDYAKVQPMPIIFSITFIIIIIGIVFMLKGYFYKKLSKADKDL